VDPRSTELDRRRGVDPANADFIPTANVPQLQRVETMVEAARAEGARVLTGGARAALADFPDGLFYGPTILDGVGNDARIADQHVSRDHLQPAVRRLQGERLGRANGAEAVEAFLQTKSVWCELSEEVQDPFVMKI